MQYYFCSLDNFKKIMESKCLWLCDLTRSNDSQEVLRAYQILWERVKDRLQASDLDSAMLTEQTNLLDSDFKLQAMIDIPFGCCFCAEDDLVQQWQEYGDKGRGIALGFDMNWFEAHGINKHLPTTSALLSHAIGYEKVIYDSTQLEDYFVELVYSSFKKYGPCAWIMAILPTFKHFAAFIKNPSFKDERETRIVYYPEDNFQDKLAILGAREENPKPHYCLSWICNGDSALKSVTIGSACSEKQVGLEAIMRDNGIPTADVVFRDSECSYTLRR